MEGNLALVVGEDADADSALSCNLKSAGFKTISAKDPEQARCSVLTANIVLVLCDWSVVQSHGPTLCEELRSLASDRYLYFILLGGPSDPPVQNALAAGADAFLSKPVKQCELNVRLQNAVRIFELQSKLNARTESLENAYASVTADLVIASKIQQDLLPKPAEISAIEASWVFKPASFVAGDMFDYFSIGEDYFVFYILDVEGHGIASALTSFAVNNQINPSSHGLCVKALEESSSIDEAVVKTVENLNLQFQGNLNSSRYFTLVYGIINTKTGDVSMVQAGHPAVLHSSKQHGGVEAVGNGGMPVGLLKEASFEAVSCKLCAGDRLFLYSDGVIECEDGEEVAYGTPRLLERIQDWGNLPIDILGDRFDGDISRWNGSDSFEDDVSMVILEFNGNNFG